jgi:uncharacterized protein (TIGR01319 family)
MEPENINVILATDCGSTTSKARFFKKIDGEYRFVAMGEAPTTVEAPYEDVTMGVLNAVREVEELTGRKLLSKGGTGIILGEKNRGVDLYVTTSSAGGGLQMLVTGVVRVMTAESAERAALGGGAIVMDVLSVDDGRTPYEKIQRIRQLRPDMVLMAGGTDGGAEARVIETAGLIRSADPKPRLGTDFRLPLIYAGNRNAREKVRNILDTFVVTVVDNIRPVLEEENAGPAREAIQHLFMEHVMSHAPGYNKLSGWTEVPIMPTPAGEGTMFQILAEQRDANLIGVGLGGATTNIYSIFDGRYVRTVSANLGMSYSICNVLREAGMENIIRWIPFDIETDAVSNRLRNKMIRPTTIPHTLEDLIVEHAVAREALRLGLKHHKFLARGLRGVRRKDVGFHRLFDEKIDEWQSYIDMMKVAIIAGTGGLLSRAPRRAQSALTLIDGFQPEGITRIYQDSVFMIPHLGVLSTVHPKAAVEIFEKDCCVPLGTCIAPRGQATAGDLAVSIITPKEIVKVPSGTITVLPLKAGEVVDVEIRPAKNFDVGTGRAHVLKTQVEGGAVGLIIDGRGRPLMLPENVTERRKKLMEWFQAMNAYDMQAVRKRQGNE